ncbi:hypothetical protein CMUS01_03252 [Colletotrichum musicola]|uniref:Uncharacterized protein n=1 Tax=Colletotrichum musicola TaxID=2175873 RepID=A0A8H6NTG7_9PEZI|nr:hypothetical protein CMUS01_03252 [Colletotrichum musicola]
MPLPVPGRRLTISDLADVSGPAGCYCKGKSSESAKPSVRAGRLRGVGLDLWTSGLKKEEAFVEVEENLNCPRSHAYGRKTRRLHPPARTLFTLCYRALRRTQEGRKSRGNSLDAGNATIQGRVRNAKRSSRRTAVDGVEWKMGNGNCDDDDRGAVEMMGRETVATEWLGAHQRSWGTSGGCSGSSAARLAIQPPGRRSGVADDVCEAHPAEHTVNFPMLVVLEARRGERLGRSNSVMGRRGTTGARR